MPDEINFNPEDALAGMPSSMDQGGEMATQEDKNELLSLIDAIKDNYYQFDSSRMASNNTIKSSKDDLKKEVLEMLKQSGVDLNDLDSIRSFISELEQTNPDMAELFSNLINGVFEDEEVPANVDEQGNETPLPSDAYQGLMSQLQ